MEEAEKNSSEPTPARESSRFWKQWLEAAKDAAKQHWKDAACAWEEYEKAANTDGNSTDDKGRTSRPYPVYWSACKTIEPAFYSRTPKVSTRRRLGVDNPVALLASKGVERLGDYLLDCTNFDEAMTAAVQDFIHADKTTVQLKYSADIEQVEQRVPLQQVAEDIFLLPDGSEWPDEVFQDQQGFYGNELVDTPTNQHIDVLPISYKDILHTPDAKNESEITEKAFRFCMDKEDAEARFDEDVLKDVSWKSKKQDSDKDKYTSKVVEENAPGQYIEGWEIWDDRTEKVLWVSTQCPKFILDIKDDLYGLKKFFPSPIFQIGSKPSNHLYPTPAYIQIKEQLEHLHTLQERILKLTDSIRRRALVSGAQDELIAVLNSSDDQCFVAVPDLVRLLENGTLQNSIFWIPVQELVASISESMSVKESVKNDIYDIFGVPDILRGSSDPLETAAAQTLKTKSAHDRFKYMKKQIAMLASDTIQMMVDLALELFTPDYINEIVGVQYLEQAEQEMWPEAYELLKNDTTRLIQIDIDTDALTFVDEQARAEQMNQTVQTVMSGLDTVSNTLKDGGDPTMGVVALKAVLLSLDMLAPGKEFQQGVRQVADGLIKKLENPPPPPPPPPDYEMMKLQVQNQKLQLEAQDMAMKNQTKQIELQLKAQDGQVKQELDAAKVRLEAENQMFEQAAEARYLELETYKAALEEMQVKAQIAESAMEEERLARQQQLETLMAFVEAQRADVEAAQTRPVTLNFQIPKRQRRSGRIVEDLLGNPRFEEEEPEVIEYQTIQQQVPAGAGEMNLTLPSVQRRSGQVQFDDNDNPSLVVEEELGGLIGG